MVCVSVFLVAGGLEACSTCRDVGTIEKREECRACKGRGKTLHWDARRCSACRGTGRKTIAAGSEYYSVDKGKYCRNCKGKGELKELLGVPCVTCTGQGVLIERVNCPVCKPKSVADTTFQSLPASDTAPAATTVQTLKVETCTLCGPDGKVKKTVLCEQCKQGYCHNKATVNEKDVFKCGKCGKVCSDKFAPCSCAKPDCPSCDGALKRVENKTCELCGGDGTITPLERAKAKKE